MRALLVICAALFFAAPAEAQLFGGGLFGGRHRGDRVNVRVRARFAPQRDRVFYQPVFYDRPAYFAAPSYFQPRRDFSLDLRFRSGGGCPGGTCR